MEKFYAIITGAKGADNTSRSIIELDIPLDADPGLVHNNSATGTLKYEFDNVFDASATQEEVFQTIAREKVLDALEGVNCTVFAYGQTGSGYEYFDNFYDYVLIKNKFLFAFVLFFHEEKPFQYLAEILFRIEDLFLAPCLCSLKN